MEKLAQYLGVDEVPAEWGRIAAELGVTEFARVRNLDFVLSPYEIYPLSPRVRPPLPRIAAFAVDMDGTSTTTEPLALHALEYMVRRITGRLTKADWAGLDERLDHPYVIGNSNFRHTEFLLGRYRDAIDRDAFAAAFIEAVAWTLTHMTDPQRRRDVQQNARNCGLGVMLREPGLRADGAEGARERGSEGSTGGATGAHWVQKYARGFQPPNAGAEVAAALDIYYMRYHSILRELERGRGDALAAELLGSGQHLVEPMPGYDVFIPLIKGWLGPEVDALYELLREYLVKAGSGDPGIEGSRDQVWRSRLVRLAEHFRRTPAKVALVTASIAYETHACMREVVRIMAERVGGWPVPAETRERLAESLADYRAVFDGFACASDVWEARLKPHRDLYSLALFQMSIPRKDYGCVVGLEDTEPGIISLRAGGIGCAVALPNHDTRRQDYTAAVEVVRGGLPELILGRNLLLAE